MKIAGLAITLVLVTLMQPSSALCPPAGMDKTALLSLKAREFELAVDAAMARDALAGELIDCLDHADPELRDGIAYEALTIWMRAGLLDALALRRIHSRLMARLRADSPDSQGFGKPFAALVLSELIKRDKTERFLSAAKLAASVETASGYMESIRDYRGFDPTEGWRHGIAHDADLLMALADHPGVDNEGLRRIISATGSQILAHDQHFYVHGEPERLARPLLVAARRGIMSADEWSEWLGAFAREPSGGSLFMSASGLNRRHNLQALLLALYLNVNESSDKVLRGALRTPVIDAIRAIN